MWALRNFKKGVLVVDKLIREKMWYFVGNEDVFNAVNKPRLHHFLQTIKKLPCAEMWMWLKPRRWQKLGKKNKGKFQLRKVDIVRSWKPRKVLKSNN